ncbi:hypothetical protein DPEC_G00157180 [Dallia pectoralis]|uniref:Uncharacterized protein n=1 Tax=Dallia pectoralis TaxID=75939 RepID=A0ACC2GL83_DALPE|nr:hypothetical protein DPEC_G00157180 [Dallia pectoralis]
MRKDMLQRLHEGHLGVENEPQERPLARTQSPHHPSSQSPFSPASPVSLMFPPVLKPVHLAASGHMLFWSHNSKLLGPLEK